MSEAEKEAIDIVKGITEDDLLNYWEGGELPYNAIQTTLNYIEKLQKENTELKEKLDYYSYYKEKESQEFDERDYWEE